MRQPFFSVAIPTFNRKPFLRKCIRSVLEQSYNNFEVIIIDDGSTDGTERLITSCKDKRINYFYQENHGVAYARNRALKLSKGSFIAFLDSDDWWDMKKLERTTEYINTFPKIKIFHTEETWYKNGKRLAQKVKHKKPTGFVYKNALPICCISISTAAIHKDVFNSVGVFDESMEACEDYDFWLRAAAKYEVKLIPEYLTMKDGGRPDQLSSRIWGLDRFRIKALEKMLSSGQLSDDHYKSTLRELEKKCSIFADGAEKRGKPQEAAHYRALPHKHTK